MITFWYFNTTITVYLLYEYVPKYQSGSVRNVIPVPKIQSIKVFICTWGVLQILKNKCLPSITLKLFPRRGQVMIRKTVLSQVTSDRLKVIFKLYQ